MAEAVKGTANTSKVMVNALIAGVIAAVINAIFYLVVQGSFTDVIAAGQPFSIIPVIVTSLIGALGGGVAYLLIDRFLGNVKRNWTILAIVVLVLFAFNPFVGLTNGNTTAIVVLEIMHLVVAGLTYYFLIMRGE